MAAIPKSSPSSDDPLAGTPYRALGELGRGGMGEVLEAEHRGLNKRVVVKLLHAQFANDPRFADRLRVEAQALAAVSSPHVVSVSDLGQTPGGRSYLVMERLHGRTLREELDLRGHFPVVEAIRIARQVLAGLAAAHRLGIIHRDVKLPNVFLCAPDDRGEAVVKVLDFGIAKVLRPEGSPARLSAPQYPTEEGTVVGSPRTMSPEQIRFLKIDARTDVYAVGLLLYTLLAGHGPFDRSRDTLELLNAHLRDVPEPPSASASQYIPPELDRAILRAVAKRPENRFQSAELFATELERIARALNQTTQPLYPVRDGRGASAGEDDAPTSPGQLGNGPDVIDANTVVMPPSATGTPIPAASSSSSLSAGVADWFAADVDEAPIATLPLNLAPPAPAQGQARLFALLTLASTLLFSLVAVLLFHFLGRP
jgi:serine/threonine-protein kinase